ncbi:3'(2')5'-bisphosphate nucleotidase [Penicillium chermesinum]|nr:3'(2')5'-bisphosphate nucleotidase [Penicillium chermesinum]
MSSKTYTKELHLASLAVQRAALLTKQLLSVVDKGSLDKSDSSPVTIADFAAQASIIAAIHHTFPDDDIVGEEDSSALRTNPALLERTWELATSVHLDDPASEALLYTPTSREELLDLIDLGATGECRPGKRAWTLDPVDGTATYMRGQQYVVCLSLVEDGGQKVGVLGCPNLDLSSGRVAEELVDSEGYGQLLTTVKSEGAWIAPLGSGALLEGRALDRVEQIEEGSEVKLVDTREASSQNLEAHERIAGGFGVPMAESCGSMMRYVAIAVRGGCNAFIKVPRKDHYRSKIWDHLGGMLLVSELGCLVTDLDGRPVDCGLGRTLADCHGMVVAPASIHGRILEAVKVARQ